MNASIPIMQLLGSAVGIGGTATTAAAPAQVGQSPFSGIIGNLMTAATGTGLSAGANGSASSIGSTSESSTHDQSILAALQSGQITPEMIAALSLGQASGSPGELAAKLAELLSRAGQGRMVPLAAGLDLEQLQAAGIELPASLAGDAGEGKAMLLVSDEALKSLMAGGAWKDGKSVPALLILGSQHDGQHSAGYLDVSLSMVAQAPRSGSSPSLSFQLSVDPAATIKLVADLSAATGPESSAPAAGAQVLELAGLLARLKTLVASAPGEQNAAADAGAGSVTGENTQTIIKTDLPAPAVVPAVTAEVDSAVPDNAVHSADSVTGENKPTGTETEIPVATVVSAPTALTMPDNVVRGAGGDTGPAQPVIQGTLPPFDMLTIEIDNLIKDLAAMINGIQSAGSEDAASGGAAALNLLAGQAAAGAENGDTRTAGLTLELIDKLGRLSSLSDGEKQQVLADLAGRLRSLLNLTGNGGTGATNPAVVSRGETGLRAMSSVESVTIISPSRAAGPAEAVKIDAASEQPAASANSTNTTVGRIADPGARNSVQFVNDSVAGPVADSANAAGTLSGLESAAATAGKMADKIVVATMGKDAVNTKAAVTLTVDQSARTQGAPIAEQQVVEAIKAQPAATTQTATTTAQAAATSAQTVVATATPESSQVAEAGQAAPTDDKSVVRPGSRRDDVGRADIRPTTHGDTGSARTEHTASLAASAEVASSSRQVSVPVSLSPLSKVRRSQSKTQTIKAVQAFTGNSQAAAMAGESNDFMQALRAAAGEKGADNLIEAILVDKKSTGEELLVRAESAEQSAKPGGSQAQAGLRIESSGVRQADTARGEQQLRPVQVQTATREEAFERIISSARLTRAGTTSELTMKLEPEHLGVMRVKMSVDENNVMHARIQVESHEARTMIESNLHRLRDSLAEQGIRIEKFSVDVRQDQQSHQQHHAEAGNGGEFDQTGRGLSGSANGSGEREGSANGSNQPEAADQNATPINKYSYSTLEWVA